MALWWVELIGLVGTLLQGFRWVSQVLETRRVGVSVNPRSFWWFTLVGNVLMLVYGVLLGAWVLVFGAVVVVVVSVLNLFFGYRNWGRVL